MQDSKYNQDMTIGEVISTNPNAEVVLMGFGMHCCGCPIGQMETLSEAANAHGVSLSDLLNELNNMPDFTGCDCDGQCGADCDCGCHDQ